ncbi:TetR/AcrR family transcriptional regulator [Phycicoccus sp. BSK3Z-2]|uniref:TetR/AcrR family transcriptional regulator n=1 Tax=Phycicoccus avicenniae TaxID=2828860 RepID=A0A941HYB3_9MICO|nr:TetR/AcrR family transcriptional regulator [Phycicoccus avicenniae]MBR7741710.1 TetR/AcrR family transcriptional regulator [Phycicoccus avicenniae]
MSTPADTTGGRRGPYRKTVRRRQEILDAALEVFAVVGYRGGSLRAVADRVGMSEAGLLHHFGSKDRLLVETLRRRDEVTEADLDFSAPGPEVLRQLVEVAARNVRAQGAIELFVVLSAEATDPDHPAAAFFRDRCERLLDRLTAVYDDLGDRGWLPEGADPASLALGTVATWDGLQVQWLHLGRAFDLPDALRAGIEGRLLRPLPGPD